jgi:PmbA protein
MPQDRSRFSYSQATLESIAADVLARARQGGASGSEVEVSEGFGQTVSVRKQQVENIEYNRDKGVGVTVYVGRQKGHANTSDFSAQAVRDTVDKALTIARFTASDEAAGLADAGLMAGAADRKDLDLFHPWDLPVDEAISLARECEAAAFRLDPRIVNSDGVHAACQQSQFVLANSNGFMAGFPSSRHYLSCAVIAEENGKMERDDWFASERDPKKLPSAAAVGDYAGRRTLARLRARKIATTSVPVLFEAPVANGLIGHFVSAVSGGSLYRKASFLVDSLGKQVFAKGINIVERPHQAGGQASTWFDDDGVATHNRDVVKDGELQGYFLSAYSARKLGMPTTGNAGGNYNLILQPGRDSLVALIRGMRRGLLVTELMGQGINLVTGDYSRGAAGYWIENGEIVHPVEEITIAGNLRDMLRGIVAVGSDVLVRGSRSCGSILVDNMTVAGN